MRVPTVESNLNERDTAFDQSSRQQTTLPELTTTVLVSQRRWFLVELECPLRIRLDHPHRAVEVCLVRLRGRPLRSLREVILKELGDLEPLFHRLLRDTCRGLQIFDRQVGTSFRIGAVSRDNQRRVIRPKETRSAGIAESKRRDADVMRQIVRLVAEFLREQRSETRIVHTLLPRLMPGQHQPSRSIVIAFCGRETANDR